MNESDEIQDRKKLFLMENLGKIKDLLDDPLVSDIMYNQDGTLFIEKIGIGKINLGKEFITPIKVKQIIELTASYNNENINRENPILESKLPTGDRIEGILYDISDNNPIMIIRCKAKKIFTLDEFNQQGVITDNQKEYLINAVKTRKNILIVGGVGSGKTTFANALLDVLNSSNERLAILEDTQELQLNTSNCMKLKTTKKICMTDLLRATMRSNIDRIVLGELRKGEETLELLKAWNSGHEGGISTIHANSSAAGLMKLEQYTSEVTQRSQISAIVESVQLVINMVKQQNRRIVKEIVEVKGYDYKNNEYILEKIER